MFGGDTYPNKWYRGICAECRPGIHECFHSVPSLIDKFKFTPQGALDVGTQVHTSPEAFGKMMSIIKPRMAVAYHFFNDYDTAPDISQRIRTTYDGPLSLATDYMVWNITKDDIRVRMAAVDEDVWPPQPSEKPEVPDPTLKVPFSEFVVKGKYDMKDVIQPTYDAINEQFDLSEKQPD